MTGPRYFTTHNECSTPEGVHRRFTLEWDTESDELVLILHTIYEPRMDETVTHLILQREAACLLFDLLGAVLLNKDQMQRDAVKGEEE
jgi:hypothetical protein